MDREKLRRYKTNKKDLEAVVQDLDDLQADLDAVEVVAGKVTKSMDDFPYIEEHMTVKMTDPERAAPIKARIRKKEERKAKLEAEIEEVETFIDALPEGMDKQIFEKAYLKGMTQQEIGEAVNLERSSISKKIGAVLKLSHNSHF